MSFFRHASISSKSFSLAFNSLFSQANNPIFTVSSRLQVSSFYVVFFIVWPLLPRFCLDEPKLSCSQYEHTGCNLSCIYAVLKLAITAYARPAIPNFYKKHFLTEVILKKAVLNWKAVKPITPALVILSILLFLCIMDNLQKIYIGLVFDRNKIDWKFGFHYWWIIRIISITHTTIAQLSIVNGFSRSYPRLWESFLFSVKS